MLFYSVADAYYLIMVSFQTNKNPKLANAAPFFDLGKYTECWFK